MKNPELVIMAAGMGSRYGGLKQIDPVDDAGHIIIDFSIYDAIRAGFRDVTFIIKHEIEHEFREVMDRHLAGISCPKALRFPKDARSRGAPRMPFSAPSAPSTRPSPSSTQTTTTARTPSRRSMNF